MRKIDFKLNNEFDEWIKTLGAKANDMSTLTGQPYLYNRLWAAFHAGASLMRQAYEKAQNPNPRKKRATIKKQIGKIEPEVIERFIPEPKPKRVYFR